MKKENPPPAASKLSLRELINSRTFEEIDRKVLLRFLELFPRGRFSQKQMLGWPAYIYDLRRKGHTPETILGVIEWLSEFNPKREEFQFQVRSPAELHRKFPKLLEAASQDTLSASALPEKDLKRADAVADDMNRYYIWPASSDDVRKVTRTSYEAFREYALLVEEFYRYLQKKTRKTFLEERMIYCLTRYAIHERGLDIATNTREYMETLHKRSSWKYPLRPFRMTEKYLKSQAAFMQECGFCQSTVNAVTEELLHRCHQTEAGVLRKRV